MRCWPPPAQAALVTTYRRADVEVRVQPEGTGRWSRVVLVAGEVVFDLPGPIFGEGPAAAASSALMTLIMRLASDSPLNAALASRLSDRADELAELRRVLQRDAASVLVEG